ncbi:nitroreductase [Pseudahrensia aquimaris]|uniref:Nitroreductase n=1 Tax=Pseudahrensia aquimaris TaxID=744461 RepID=A0ABW3FDM9_9HYPH
MTNAAIINEAIAGRRSVRAFFDTPIPRQTIIDILQTAARAPSGTNMQPWKVTVATGETLKTLCDAVVGAHNDPNFEREQTYKYYPDQFPEPFLARRRKVGWDMYGLLGIEKGDKEKMHAQHGENYRFFGAPVGMMFTMDKRLEIGSWLDYGMFLQNIMIAARGHGLETCPQAAWAPFHKVIRPVLNIPDEDIVLCGMALGYEDTEATINTLKVDRAPLEDFAVFLD